jgi:hypothetical protein
MGLRGPHAHSLSAKRAYWESLRKQPASMVQQPTPRVVHTLTCWACRKRFQSSRIDATYCSNRCRQEVYRRRKLADASR